MLFLNESYRQAQRAWDSMLPPEDPWEHEWELARESTLVDLQTHRRFAALYEDEPSVRFWDDRIAERPQPEDTDLFLVPDGENRAVIYNSATGENTATWPLWLEAICPGYSPEKQLATALRSLQDLHHHLREELIP